MGLCFYRLYSCLPLASILVGPTPNMNLDDRNIKRRLFRLGDTVRIVAGPFAEFTGKIEGINKAKTLLKVKVAIFQRNTPVKLQFSDIENVSRS